MSDRGVGGKLQESSVTLDQYGVGEGAPTQHGQGGGVGVTAVVDLETGGQTEQSRRLNMCII